MLSRDELASATARPAVAESDADVAEITTALASLDLDSAEQAAPATSISISPVDPRRAHQALRRRMVRSLGS